MSQCKMTAVTGFFMQKFAEIHSLRVLFLKLRDYKVLVQYM